MGQPEGQCSCWPISVSKTQSNHDLAWIRQDFTTQTLNWSFFGWIEFCQDDFYTWLASTGACIMTSVCDKSPIGFLVHYQGTDGKSTDPIINSNSWEPTKKGKVAWSLCHDYSTPRRHSDYWSGCSCRGLETLECTFRTVRLSSLLLVL